MSKKTGSREILYWSLVTGHCPLKLAGKVSGTGGFTRVCGHGKIPKAQPAYAMEERAHIFGERLQLPQRHGLTLLAEGAMKREVEESFLIFKRSILMGDEEEKFFFPGIGYNEKDLRRAVAG